MGNHHPKIEFFAPNLGTYTRLLAELTEGATDKKEGIHLDSLFCDVFPYHFQCEKS
jgi:hypothetical protein